MPPTVLPLCLDSRHSLAPAVILLFLTKTRWERWSEEAYEGWGWGNSTAETADDAALGDADSGNSSFGALFRRPGVVYPIHPTGHLSLPRPKLPFKRDTGAAQAGGGQGNVTFVVQVGRRVGRARPGKRDHVLQSFFFFFPTGASAVGNRFVVYARSGSKRASLSF